MQPARRLNKVLDTLAMLGLMMRSRRLSTRPA
jgi:hypothetical protein